jgi:flagellar biosynthesis GTPase FlhF
MSSVQRKEHGKEERGKGECDSRLKFGMKGCKRMTNHRDVEERKKGAGNQLLIINSFSPSSPLQTLGSWAGERERERRERREKREEKREEREERREERRERREKRREKKRGREREEIKKEGQGNKETRRKERKKERKKKKRKKKKKPSSCLAVRELFSQSLARN